MRNVVFIENKIPSGDKEFNDLVQRWGKYQSLFKQNSGGNTFSIFSFSSLSKQQKINLANYSINEFVDLQSNPISRLALAKRKIRSIPVQTTLVCGDNQLSLFTALILKKFMIGKVFIQTQFHGDTYSFSSNKGIRGFLRVCLSMLAIRISDSIRVVSEFQIKEIDRLSGSHKVSYVIAPIPIDFRRIPEEFKDRDIDLLYVGRFHKERGIKELVTIIKEINRNNPSLRINLVGTGPLLRFAIDELVMASNSGNVVFSGYLNSEELRDVYSRSKVLISTAPKEGYGLTLREGALSAVSVVARLSNGSLEASRDFPDEITTYTSAEEAINQIMDAIKKNSRNISPDAKFKQMNKDLLRLNDLFDSWEGC